MGRARTKSGGTTSGSARADDAGTKASGGAARRGPARRKAAPDEPAAVETALQPVHRRAGAAIRRNRLDRGLTLAELAAASGMSIAMLSRIENGQSAASLEVLERLTAALGIGLAALFEAIEDTAGTAQLIKAGDQMEVVRTGTRHGHAYKLLAYQKGPRKAFEPFLIEMNQDSGPHPRFQHPGTELIYMLSGRMEYCFGDRVFLLEPGDSFTFSGAVVHGPRKLLDPQIRFLSIIVYGE